MAKQPTKADLLTMLAERDTEIRKLDQQEREASSAARTHELSAEAAQERLTACRNAICQHLLIHHDVPAFPDAAYSHGEPAVPETVTEEVRFLRHLLNALDE